MITPQQKEETALLKRIADNKELHFQILSEINKVGIFSQDDIKWCKTILERPEREQVGTQQMAALAEACMNYNQNPPTNPFAVYKAQEQLSHALTTMKSFFYRQRKIVVCQASRKQIFPDGTGPISLKGLISPQHINSSADTVYGLSHEEARTYFVDKYLADTTISHLLFVDDDVLLPLNAISHLMGLNLDVVSGNYYKKHELLEGTTTEIREDSRDVFNNFLVSGEDPTDLVPRLVNCIPLGFALIDLHLFRRLPKPWFKFEKDPVTNRVMIGEDAYFTRICLQAGIKSWVVPGLVGIHCDFLQSKEAGRGVYYGPSWLVTPDHKIKPEFINKYTSFICEPGLLHEANTYDNSDVFDRGPAKQKQDELKKKK